LCFGNFAALNFNTGVPVDVSRTSMNAGEGSASISDKNGNLLFYTNGDSVWDQTHKAMPNGFGLKGHTSSTQSAIILKKPGSSSQYYIFTVTGRTCPIQHGLNYSIVDMNAMGNGTINPLGDLTTKNVFLTDSTAEKLTAVMDLNLVSHWIVVSKWYGNEFYAYHVTCDGVETTPIISTFNNVPKNGSDVGYLQASGDGKSLVAAFSGGIDNGTLIIYDFNNSTGEISNRRVITSGFSNIGCYGVEFSPDDKLIYSTNGTGNSIRQYQRFAVNIGASEKIISSIDSSYGLFGLQLAPDDKIYIATIATGYIARVENPNDVNNPIVIERAKKINVGTSNYGSLGLPNFYKYYLKGDSTKIIVEICKGNSIKIGPAECTGCLYNWSPSASLSNLFISNPIANPTVTTSYLLTVISKCNDTIKYTTVVKVNDVGVPKFSALSVGCEPFTVSFFDTTSSKTKRLIWDFGDGNFSNISTPQNTYSNSGVYSVKLVVSDTNGCKDSLVKTNYINVYGVNAEFSSSTSRISIFDTEVNFTDLSVSNAGAIKSWNWNFGDNSSSSILQYPKHNFNISNTDVDSFLVKLVVVDSMGCMDSVTHGIYLNKELLIYIPSSFTPNEDGLNDVFKIVTIGTKKIDLNIYDRWGNIVFQTNEINRGWDGNVRNGLLAQQDVYIVTVNATNDSNAKYSTTGRISLIR